uniref:Uncharacterized protein n=1 Tax=Rhipicephalus appendiculatus TaxID=34631 RepID=A0A131YES8_RHIAP
MAFIHPTSTSNDTARVGTFIKLVVSRTIARTDYYPEDNEEGESLKIGSQTDIIIITDNIQRTYLRVSSVHSASCHSRVYYHNRICFVVTVSHKTTSTAFMLDCFLYKIRPAWVAEEIYYILRFSELAVYNKLQDSSAIVLGGKGRITAISVNDMIAYCGALRTSH